MVTTSPTTRGLRILELAFFRLRFTTLIYTRRMKHCEWYMDCTGLLDKLCNGTRVDINHTGTVVKYKPGLLIGGKITHDCPPSRAIGYFLEAIICMAPFAKKPFALTLTGVTNNEQDPSVDVLRTVTLPLIRRFGVEDGLELKVSGFFLQPYPFSLQVVALDFFLSVLSSILGRVV